IKALPLGISHLIDSTELSVWWCAALDRALLSTLQQRAPDGGGRPAFSPRAAMERGGRVPLQHRTLTLKHLLNPLNRAGPFFLPGSIATIRQGNHVAGQTIVPAYRFITDLSTDEAYTSVPSEDDLQNWLYGNYKRLFPPTGD